MNQERERLQQATAAVESIIRRFNFEYEELRPLPFNQAEHDEDTLDLVAWAKRKLVHAFAVLCCEDGDQVGMAASITKDTVDVLDMAVWPDGYDPKNPRR